MLKSGNLLKQNMKAIASQSIHTMLNNKSTIVYDPISLRLMESAVHTIRKLGLNARPASRRHHKRKGFAQTGANMANLVTIKKIAVHDPNVIIATVNVQSLKT